MHSGDVTPENMIILNTPSGNASHNNTQTKNNESNELILTQRTQEASFLQYKPAFAPTAGGGMVKTEASKQNNKLQVLKESSEPVKNKV